MALTAPGNPHFLTQPRPSHPLGLGKTHARASANPWTASEARGFLEALLGSPGFDLLVATPRHAAVLAQVVREIPEVGGNLFHDPHTAVLMREHGVSRICTHDTDFHRFPFLSVVDPLRIDTDRP